MVGDAASALLHALRLRGVITAGGPVADELCEAGLARRRGLTLAITSAGRARADASARLEPGSAHEAAARRAHEQFLALNRELLAVSSDWQVRPGGVTNDHSEAAYDWQVVERLTTLDERAGPVLRRLGANVERFRDYPPRLHAALARLREGEHDWFVAPQIDSYHTVWMQLHEDLLLALGLARTDEAGAEPG